MWQLEAASSPASVWVQGFAGAPEPLQLLLGRAVLRRRLPLARAALFPLQMHSLHAP